jgi:hypothetical protein
VSNHRFHSICPYFAMFPPDFVADQVLLHTKPGDFVFDPFCGRGTTLLESLLHGRKAAGLDINPVATCITGAKIDAPIANSIYRRIDQLEVDFPSWRPEGLPESKFFSVCFHRRTLTEIVYLRSRLRWRTSRVDRFIAAVVLGCLHGESHKSRNCLSNRMPRTISTKPEYSVRWWSSRKMEAPDRATFDVVRRMVHFRLRSGYPPMKGSIREADARKASLVYPSLKGKVKLFVTSPPYIDTTNFREDQWLRLWFLGGPAQPNSKRDTDDRHRGSAAYWRFLTQAWRGCMGLPMKGATIVVRLGGSVLAKDELFEGLYQSMQDGFETFCVSPLHDGVSSQIRNRQTNVFRPGTRSMRYEHDFAFSLN